ncbi:MAG TPA: hypothetical protein VG937_00070 [Polyangiaceae bacterium]|nr:hypothetical protein [Polyangiaceae bacterium]
MPMMTEAQVQSLANTLEGYESREKKFKSEKKEQHKKWLELLMAGANVGGAALAGFVHGRYEDADGNFFIPRTSIPADFAIGLAGIALGFSEKVGKGGDVVFNLSTGVLSGATAMYFRKHSLAGKQSDKFWAGLPELYGPQTHNHPAIGAAPVNSAMTDSELAQALRKAL